MHFSPPAVRRRAATCSLASWQAWLLVWLGCWLLAGTAGAQTVSLTEAERAWIAQHGEVRVVVARSSAPIYSVPADGGPPRGFGIDLLALIAERTGLKLRYVVVDTAALAVEAFVAGRVDMTPLAAPSPERAKLGSFPGPLIDAEWVIASRREVGDTSAQQSFVGRRVAVVRSEVPSEMLRQAYPDTEMLPMNSVSEAVKAVADGRADLAVGWTHEVLYAIESQFLANLQVRREPGAPRSFLGPAVSLRLPLLHSIIAKGLQALTPAERSAVAQRWLPRGADTHWGSTPLVLTAAERDWIARHGSIRLGFDAQFAPFTSSDRMGRFDGLGADMLRLAASKVGLRINEQRGGAFADMLAAARNGELNVLVGMARNADRRAEFDFVGPFISVPTAMVMRLTDGRQWQQPDQMDNARLGLLRHHFLIPQLRSRKPALPLVEFDTQDEVLRALDNGTVDAAIGNATVVGRLMEQHFAGRLHFTGVVPDGDSELYFGVPRRDAELARLLRLGFEAITPGEAVELQQRWLRVSVHTGLSLTDVLRWALPAGLATVLVLAVLWLANRRLHAAHQREREARDTAEQAVAARGRFLAYLSHELRGTVAALSGGVHMLQEQDDPAPRRRLLGAMQQTAEQLHSLLESTLAHERTLAGGLQATPCPTPLGHWWASTLAPLVLAAERKGVQLTTTPPPSAPTPLFDGPRLGQVLSNLLDNALKFSPEGSTVSASADWDGHQLRLRVADSGPGIAEAERALVFEPYRQGAEAQRLGQGAGLGLAISRQIVSAMGGTLRLASSTAAGCVFEVRVPAPAATPASNPEAGAYTAPRDLMS